MYVCIYIFCYFYICYDKIVDVMHKLHNAQIWQDSNYRVFFCGKFRVVYDLADYQQLLLENTCFV